MNNSKNLREQKRHDKRRWSLEEIKSGLEYFKKKHKKYPSAQEIDAFNFLPSVRSIQRTYNGLPQLRTLLNFDPEDIDLTKGSVRSEKMKKTYANAVTYELKFYNYLLTKIPEVKIHEHKILRPGHVCCDFFIYTSENGGFAIDVFYAQDLNSLQHIVQIKYLRYKFLQCKVYFVLVENKFIEQDDIDRMISNRKHVLPNHITVLVEDKFKSYIDSLYF